MLTPGEAHDRAQQLVERAMALGADAGDAIFVGEASSAVDVRLGALEDVRRSEGAGIGLRLFVGNRSASASSSDLSPQALGALAERVLAMAREAPEDPYAGLAPADLLARAPFAELDSWDGAEPDPAALKARALEAEDAARAVEGVTNSNGASAAASASVVALATSHGFAGAYRASGFSCSASVIAGEGAAMRRDYDYHSARHLADLEAAATIGARAARRAVDRLGDVRAAPGPIAVLFEPRVASSLLGHFVGAIAGAAVARKSSFLQDRLGSRIFASGVVIRDDPHRPRGLRSRAFDGEGLPTRPLALVDDGVLTGWLAESASARQLGIAPTGHAARGVGGAPGASPSNLYLEAGARSPEAMLAGLPRAILVTELIGQGVNPVTGDYSRGAAGFLYERGERVGPVSEVTIAANLVDMFASLEPASDLALRHGIDSPTVLVPAMTLASA